MVRYFDNARALLPREGNLSERRITDMSAIADATHFDLAARILLLEKSWLPHGPIAALGLLGQANAQDITQDYITLCVKERNPLGVAALVLAKVVFEPSKAVEWLTQVSRSALGLEGFDEPSWGREDYNFSFLLGLALALMQVNDFHHESQELATEASKTAISKISITLLQDIVIRSFAYYCYNVEVCLNNQVSLEKFEAEFSSAAKSLLQHHSDTHRSRLIELFRKVAIEANEHRGETHEGYNGKEEPAYLPTLVVNELGYALYNSLDLADKAKVLGAIKAVK